MEKSHVSVQAKISKAFLQKAIEKELKGILGSDGLTLNLPQGALLIESIENVQYKVSSKNIELAADIEIEYSKEEGVNIAGQATINVVFNIAYQIKSDFTLETKTLLKEHSWTENPRVKVGKLKIPSKAALNLLISTFDDKLGREIDEIIRKKVNLHKLVTAQLTKLENPIPNPVDKNIHLFVQPADLLFNIQEGTEEYNLSIHTSFEGNVKWEKLATQKIFSALPRIEEYDGTKSSSQINVPVKVNYAALSKMLERQLASVKVIGRTLQVKDIKLRYTDRLLINAQIEGDFSVALQAEANLRLDASSQTIHMDNLVYDLKTSNFLVKAAVFVFKGEIDKQLHKFSKVPLQPIIKPLIANLNQKLTEFDIEGLDFAIHLDSFEAVNLELQQDHLLASFEIKANQALA